MKLPAFLSDLEIPSPGGRAARALRAREPVIRAGMEASAYLANRFINEPGRPSGHVALPRPAEVGAWQHRVEASRRMGVERAAVASAARPQPRGLSCVALDKPGTGRWPVVGSSPARGPVCI